MIWILFLAIFCGSCVADVELIAHRGASVEAPENTMSAFQKALDIGVSCIECDVHLTKDNIPVISHDGSIPYDRTQSTTATIPTLLYSQLVLYDVGKWFHETFVNERVPTLEQLLKMQRGKTALMLELKKGQNSAEKLVSSVLEVLQKNGAKNVYIGSFDPDIVRALQEQKVPYSIQGICSTYDNFYERFPNSPQHVVMCADYVTKEVVEAFHKEGKKVWTYTVDSPRKAQRLREYGIDGIITNDPRVLQEVFRNR